MKWNCDSYYEIGSSHRVCQDYAMHGDSCGVLSDGCSSAPDTDIGARLICRNAMMGYEQMPMGMLLKYSAMLGIPREALFATQLSIGFGEYEWTSDLFVTFGGDGFVIALSEQNEVEYLQVDFENNMPWYPVYHEILRTDEEKERFKSTLSGKYHGMQLDVETGCDPVIYLDPEKYKFAAICSDGFGTFADANGPIAVEGLIRDLANIAVPSGEFIQRRIRALKRGAWKDYFHFDDFSIVAMVKEPG